TNWSRPFSQPPGGPSVRLCRMTDFPVASVWLDGADAPGGEMVRRREFLAATVGLATLSLSAHSQPERRVRKIGYLSQASAQVNAARLAAFRAGMLELRWVEGR